MPGSDFDSVGRPVPFEFDTAESFTLPVPDGEIWEVQAIAFRWIATATVGDRNLLISVEGGNGERLYRRSCKRNQTANEAVRYCWAPGVPDEDDIPVLPAGGGGPAPYLMQSMPLLTISGPSAEISIQDSGAVDVLDTLKGTIAVRVYSGGPK